MAVTLITYHDKRRAKDGSSIDTIREVIERWAPPHENNTLAYVNEVSKAVGVAPDMIIDLHDYETLRPLVSGQEATMSFFGADRPALHAARALSI